MFTQAFLISGLAALAAAQSSVLTFTHVPDPVTDGEAQAITYATNDTSSPVTIILRQGQSNNLQTVETLTTSATGGQYIWTPSKSLADGSDYALEITQGNQVNYFGPFEVQGQSNSAVSSASSASSAKSTSSASANSTGTGVPVGGAPGTANSTMSGSANATSTGTGVAGGATGHGNSTAGPNSNMNSTATMTASTSGQLSTGGPASISSAATAASGSGAGFQSSATGAAGASSTGTSSAGLTASSSISLFFGAVGALMYFL